MNRSVTGSVLPVAVITVVAVLLAAFLYLYLSRPQVRPAEPTVAPQSTGSIPSGQSYDERAQQRQTLTEECRKALEQGELERAAELAAKLRDLGDTQRAAELGREIDEALRVRREKGRAAAEQAFADVEETLQKLKDEFRWDAVRARLQELEQAHPPVTEVSRFRRLRRDVEEQSKEALATFRESLRLAEESLAAGRWTELVDRAEQARLYYPERSSEIDGVYVRAKELKLADSMVFIPEPPEGSSWTIGDNAHPDEAPAHPFRRSDFFIDRMEVANDDYLLFIAMASHPPPRSRQWKGNRIVEGYERHPVTGVTADDALAFARWAGKRLPTEEEWTAAARWLDGRTWPWGDAFQPEETTYLCNSVEYSMSRRLILPLPVGSFPNGRSTYGVYDMAGNVWEWTASTRTVESDGGPRVLQVCKGGSFATPAELTRISNVYLEDPQLAHWDIGFRCARDPEPK